MGLKSLGLVRWIGVVVRALAASPPPPAKKKRNLKSTRSEVFCRSSWLYSSKGILEHRTCAVGGLLGIRVSLPGRRFRKGSPQNPAKELLTATLSRCTCAFEHCRREVEDEGDLDPPQKTPAPQVVVEPVVALLVYSLLESYKVRWEITTFYWFAPGILQPLRLAHTAMATCTKPTELKALRPNPSAHMG